MVTGLELASVHDSSGFHLETKGSSQYNKNSCVYTLLAVN